MKKTIFAMGAALALFSMASCAGNNSGKCCNEGGVCKDKDMVYTGVIPAADTDGIRYSLTLDYDDDDNYMKGDYDLLETYIQSDSTSFTGYKDLKSFKSEGDFTVEKKDGKTYLKLVQDVKDSQAGSNGGPIYFEVASDSTLTMVNAEYQLPTRPQDYTLNLVK